MSTSQNINRFTPELCLAVLLIWLQGVSGSATSRTLQEQPEARFLRGKKLVELNCGDCLGANKQGLAAGIAELETAIELNYEDKKAALMLLGEAYNTLAYVYVETGSEEQRDVLETKKNIYRDLLQLAPTDPEALFLYADSLDAEVERFDAFKAVLEVDPEHTEARFFVGSHLLKSGEIDAGIEELKQSFALATEINLIEEYGTTLIRILNEHGREEEAQEISRELEERTRGR